MPTVINNGTSYNIVKAIHCGNEYCFGSSGPKIGYIDLLVVGGGGNGGSNTCCTCFNGGGGGGGGGVVVKSGYILSTDCSSYIVKVGGAHSDTCFGNIKACRGGNGGGRNGSSFNSGYEDVESGGSGGGGGGRTQYGGSGVDGQGYSGGGGAGGGGGGGGAAGGVKDTSCNIGACGGIGVLNDFSGEAHYYGSGGGGGITSSSSTSCGQGLGGCGAGNGGLPMEDCCNGTSATYYGGGGGGGGGISHPYRESSYKMGWGGGGCQGIVILRYKTDGSYGLSTSSQGGCKYTCGDYTIHCFTNTSIEEEFIPVYK